MRREGLLVWPMAGMSRREREAMPRFDEALTLELYVEGTPVSTNAMYGVGRRGRGARYLSREASEWRASVFAETQVALVVAGHPTRDPVRFRLPLKVACLFYGSRADADSLLKLTLDGLKEGLGIDDRHFAVVESGKAPAFIRNGRRFRGCWIGVWESMAAAATSAEGTQGGAA